MSRLTRQIWEVTLNLFIDEHVRPLFNAVKYLLQGDRKAAAKCWRYVWRQ